MIGKRAVKLALDTACCVASRTTGVPIPRPYTPAAEARFGSVRLVAVHLAEVAAFWASHPRAMTAADAEDCLNRNAARSEAAESAAADVMAALHRMRHEYPSCLVFLVRDTPAVG